MTQHQLADRAGVGQPQISRVEKEKATYDGEFLERVAAALGCTPADIIMRGPSDPEGLWGLHEALTPPQRVELVEHGKIILKRRERA